MCRFAVGGAQSNIIPGVWKGKVPNPNQILPKRCPDNEDGGLFEEQRRKGALAHNFAGSKKRKSYNTPGKHQEREAKADDLVKRFEQYLKPSRSKRQKASEPSPRMGECQDSQAETEYVLSGDELRKLIDQARRYQEAYKSSSCDVPPSGLAGRTVWNGLFLIARTRTILSPIRPPRKATRSPAPGDEEWTERICRTVATNYNTLQTCRELQAIWLYSSGSGTYRKWKDRPIWLCESVLESKIWTRRRARTLWSYYHTD